MLQYPLLRLIKPELAHSLMIWGLRSGLLKPDRYVDNPKLRFKVLGMDFKHPIGLAAGFDKNAECISALLGKVFSFIEVGSVTVNPQMGNIKPRIFRLYEDEAVINRLGFNNKGINKVLSNIKKANKDDGIIGVNIGMSKNSLDPICDYQTLFEKLYNCCHYITANLSSPNTVGLRKLQYGKMLKGLVESLINSRMMMAEKNCFRIPILLKIAPDMSIDDARFIAEIAMEYGIDGIILTNTTIAHREGLNSAHVYQEGGLSGKPLFAPSNVLLQNIYRVSRGRLVLIGCGGVSSSEDAYTKIKLGASLVQLYTGLIYHGFSLISRIINGLIELLHKDGFENISEAVGVDCI